MKNYFYIVLILGIIFPYNFLFAQEIGMPFIRNYTIDDYEGHIQNWGTVTDQRGVVYIANLSAILEYDGVEWRKIYNENETYILSINIAPTGRIFVGSVGDIGYLAPDSLGLMQYNSLFKLIDTAENKFTDVRKIVTRDDNVYFQTQEKILVYQTKTNTIKIIKPETIFHNCLYFENRIFFRQKKLGLYELIDDSLHLIPHGNTFDNKTSTVHFFSPFYPNKNQDKHQFLINMSKKGLFIFEPENKDTSKIFSTFNEKISQFCIKNILYGGLRTKQNNYVINTLRQGAFVFDNTGEILQPLSKSSGLQDNVVINMFEAQTGLLWLNLNNGNATAEINSPFTMWDKETGFSGTIRDITRFQNTLYIITLSDLYYLNTDTTLLPNQIHNFVKVEKKATQYLDLYKFPTIDSIQDTLKNNELLLLATEKGVFQINETQVEKIFTLQDVMKLFSSKFYPNILFIATHKGFFVAEYKEQKWEVLGKINNTDYDYRDILHDSKGNIWLASNYNGVFKVKFEKNINNSELLNKSTVIKYDTTNGLPTNKRIKISNINSSRSKTTDTIGDPVFLTKEGLYKYDEEKNTFLLDTIIIPKKEREKFFFSLIQTIEGDIFLNKKTLLKLNSENKYSIDSNSISRLQNYNFDCLYPDTNGIVWFGSNDCLIRYDSKNTNTHNSKYYALIRRVITNSDTIFHGTNFSRTENNYYTSLLQPKELKYKLKYSNNSLLFNYAAAFFIEESSIQYCYKLEGYETEWSEWTEKTEKEYTNLHEGKYTFKVKAKNIYNSESVIGTFEFKVFAPWYRTILAYIGYIIFSVLFIWLIIKLNSRRLIKAKEHLEQVVKQRTSEIRLKNAELEQQKEEILTQAENLETAYNEISTQKNKIEKTHDQIKASINYASRIQDAMFPIENIFKQNFVEYFILYKPRDVVSGDFYWIKNVNQYKLVAVADCTGHGVPGAFLSMLGISLLNEIVKNKDVTTANRVLDILREQIKTSLKQTGKNEEAKDGMDIALCVINTETNELQYAGANNPIYIIRNNNRKTKEVHNKIKRHENLSLQKNNYLIEIKADKQPISIYIKEHPFTNITLQLFRSDNLYLFSDGYTDQFGGKKSEKFKKRALRKLLLSNTEKSFLEQKQILNKTFANWISHTKPNGRPHKQIDDVLVLAVKI